MTSSSWPSRSPSSSARMRSEIRSSVSERAGARSGSRGRRPVRPAARMAGVVVDDVQLEDLFDVVDPAGEQLPILRRCAQQRADDWCRIAPAMSATMSQRPMAANGSTSPVMISAARWQPLSAAGCEGLGHQPAQPVMHCAVEAQDVRGGPVPERTRGDALHAESKALRRDKSVVAQHGAGQFVGQHLGPVRADRDGGLRAGPSDDAVRFVGVGSWS